MAILGFFGCLLDNLLETSSACIATTNVAGQQPIWIDLPLKQVDCGLILLGFYWIVHLVGLQLIIVGQCVPKVGVYVVIQSMCISFVNGMHTAQEAGRNWTVFNKKWLGECMMFNLNEDRYRTYHCCCHHDFHWSFLDIWIIRALFCWSLLLIA